MIHPFGAMLAGPSGCGKSTFVVELIKHSKLMFTQKYHKIIWCYYHWQDLFDEVKKDCPFVLFHKGIYNHKSLDRRYPTLIILDDLMSELNQDVVDMFTKGSHHLNMSVIFLTQNIFNKTRGSRDVSLNTHYIVYFKNPRDSAQFHHLARQIHPNNPKFLIESYKDATLQPHGYLFIDLKQQTPEDLRFRTKVLPNETCVYYVEKPRK